MKNFFVWCQHSEGWKTVLALVYAFICLFDFVIVPAWIGITRPGIEVLSALDTETLNIIYNQHSPFTLQGGGLFHLAFGALLTGSAISRIPTK